MVRPHPLSELGAGWLPKIRELWARLQALESAFPGSLAQNVILTPELENQFVELLDRTVSWNKTHDLTAARTPEELVDLTLADALVVARATRTEPAAWLDVGSGGGAPGIPLALLCPRLQFTLCEPRTKRVAFLRTSLANLGRTDVKVERKRSSELQGASVQVAISRATLGPEEWLAEGARLATKAVWVLLAQGSAPTLSGFEVDFEARYEWPLSQVPRRALRYSRVGSGAGTEPGAGTS